MKTKRIFAAVLAILVLAMSVSFTAFAADDGTIIIRDSESGDRVASRTFNIYKVFNATVSGSAISYQWYIPSGASESPYYDFFYTDWKGTDTLLLDPNDGKGDSQERAAQYMRSLTADDLMILSVDLQDYITAKGIDPTDTKTAADNALNVQFENLEYGYYLIYDSTDNPEIRAAVILTSVAPDSVVKLKAEKPAISKTFNGANKNGSAMIGDVINFDVTTIVPEHTFFTTSYTYSITDAIPASLTLDEASITIKKDDVALTPDVDYTLTVAGQSITVNFLKVLEYDKGEKLSITYKARLNDGATSEHHTLNTATLTYSSDPSDLSATATTSSSTDIHTYYIELTKVAEENFQTVLNGAKFKFNRIVDGNHVSVNLTEVAAGSYKVAVGTASGDAELVTVNGKLKIDGLAAGRYCITELVAPDGYKLPLDDFEFTITETFATDGSSKLDGIAMENITTTNTFGRIIEPVGNVTAVSGGSDLGYVTFKLTNEAGTALPETGGMGTTLFTIGGILLMAVALGFFMAPKRNNA